MKIEDGTTDKRMYTNMSGPVVMNEPRYDGTASAHVSTLGGRYDYTFDCHDRLIRADYQETDDRPRANPENFSTEYTYNEGGAPLN